MTARYLQRLYDIYEDDIFQINEYGEIESDLSDGEGEEAKESELSDFCPEEEMKEGERKERAFAR